MSTSIWSGFIHPILGHFRARRGAFIRQHFPGIEQMKVCDLGGSIHFWQELGIRIEADKLTILNIDEGASGAVPGTDAPPYKVVLYDGVTIPFPDGHFDLLVCNSVIEHVPVDQRPALAREMRRVSKRFFCQTPAYEFPIEPHFVMPAVHWLPRGLGFKLIHASPWRILARPDAETIASYFHGTHLLQRRELEALFPDAVVSEERVLGLPKSYYVLSAPSSPR
jgi:SAM-dependent methyltransferase